MQKIIPLVVTERDGKPLATPILDYFNFAELQDIIMDAVLGTQIQIAGERVRVAEKPFDLEALADLASTDLIISQRVAAAVAALGAAQGDGYDVIKFLTEITTATASSADGVDLPAAVEGGVRCLINNNATVTLDLFPASGENFDGGTANVAVTLAPAERKHFYCATDGRWDTVVDNGS